MSEFSSPEAAAAALAGAVASDQGIPVPDSAPGSPGPGAAPGNFDQPVTPADAPVPAEPVAPAAPEVEGTPSPEDDSLLRAADINLEGLTPEATEWLQAREREMQAVMTKRTQEAAAIREQYADLDDPAAAREALAFYKGIQEDPNYAAEVFDFMAQNLTAAGYSPAQAAAKALEAMGSADPVVDAPAPSFEDDPDAAIQARLEQLDRRQAEIDARFSAAEAKEQEQILINQILTQDNAIRQANDNITDEDMDYVYSLAESTGGDLFKAHEMYATLQEQAVQSYLARKGGGDAPPEPTATPPGLVTRVPRTLDEGMAMGLERIRQEQAANN